MSSADAGRIHREAIIIDEFCPLVQTRRYLDRHREGGFTACAPAVAIHENARQTVKELGAWHDHVRRNPDLVIIRRTADIERAKRDGRFGLILHFQNTDPIESDLSLVDACKAPGVGVMQLCHNLRNRVGTTVTVD